MSGWIQAAMQQNTIVATTNKGIAAFLLFAIVKKVFAFGFLLECALQQTNGTI